MRWTTLSLALLALGCDQKSNTSSPVPSASAAPTPAPVAASAPAPVLSAPPALPPMAQSGTKLTWLGHAAFKLQTPSGKVLFIDPWIQNPKNPTGKDDLGKIDKADLILVSHGHFDHVGDAVAIAKKTKAKLVTTFDTGNALAARAGYPKDQMGFDTLGNFGGEIAVLDGEVTIRFVPAVHSSAVQNDKGESFEGGNPGGFVIAIKNGPVIYHTGDTDVFNDMALVPLTQPVTVMLASIGDHFVMGPERAAQAVKLVRPAMVVPMHFGTFPVLTGTPEALSEAMKKHGLQTKLQTMTVQQTLDL